MESLIDNLDGARIKNIAQTIIGKLSPVSGWFLIVKKHLSKRSSGTPKIIGHIDIIDKDVASAISLLDFLINNIPESAELEGVIADIVKQKEDKYRDRGISINYNETQKKLYKVDKRVLDVINDVLDIAIPLCKNNRINIEIQNNNDTNVKIIISEMAISDFHSTAELLEKFRKYISSITIKIIKEVGNGDTFEITSPIFPNERKKIMIIELLTTATAGAGIKFLFDRLGKSVDRVNDEQLAKIRKAESAKNDQELEPAKDSMRELRKIDPKIDSVDSFVLWVEERVRSNYDDLFRVSKLVLDVLIEKTKSQADKVKKDKLLKMESGLADEIQIFEDALDTGDSNSQIRRNLHERMKKALEFIKA